MIGLEVTTRIGRPIDEVYAFASDPANRTRWDTSVVSEELTSPGPLRAGSTMHARMRVMGQDAEFDWRVDEVSPPHRLAVSSTAGPMEVATVLALASANAGTDVTISLTARPEGMMRLVEPIIEQAIRRDLTAALGRLKELLETGRG